MKLSLSLASLILLANSVIADEGYHHYGHEELTYMACKGAVFQSSAYCAKETATTYKCNCKNKPALGSLVYCLYDKTKLYDEGIEDQLIDYCQESNVTLTHEAIRKAYDNATNYIVDVSTIDGYNKSEIHDFPVIYNKKKYKNYYQSYKVRWANIDDAMYFGSALLGYWAVIFLFAIITNFLNRVGFISKHFHSKPVNWIRKHISLPSLFPNKRHTHPIEILKVLGGYIPTRIESVVIFFYFVLLFVFSGVRYTYVENDTIWKSKGAQASRYPGDRTGISALFSFQLVFLFVGRNNFLIWLTGWKQATFYTYHKWISRFNFILVLIHAGSMHVQSVTLGKFKTRILTDWYRSGIVAVIAAGIMVFTAGYKLRKASYETFLLIHIVFGIVFLAASWVHAKDFGYQTFSYAMLAVWAFDRLVRILRLFSFGVQNAQVTIVSDEILKVVVPRRSFWKAFPGAYGYIHYITPTTFFQSHPFTIVETSDSDITFFTKIKGGVTSHIHRQLSGLPNQTGTIKVSVEGPYGNTTPLQKYDTTLFYTGGTGIAGPFSHVYNLVQKGKDQSQHIKLYWTIRDLKSLTWFQDELLKLKGSAVNVIIYVTQSSQSTATLAHDSTSESEKNSSNNEKLPSTSNPEEVLDFVEFRYGRPSIESLVKADFEESNGTVAVVTAAHNSLVDDVRYSVSENLDSAKGRVDYVEELQVW